MECKSQQKTNVKSLIVENLDKMANALLRGNDIEIRKTEKGIKVLEIEKHNM